MPDSHPTSKFDKAARENEKNGDVEKITPSADKPAAPPLPGHRL